MVVSISKRGLWFPSYLHFHGVQFLAGVCASPLKAVPVTDAVATVYRAGRLMVAYSPGFEPYMPARLTRRVGDHALPFIVVRMHQAAGRGRRREQEEEERRSSLSGVAVCFMPRVHAFTRPPSRLRSTHPAISQSERDMRIMPLALFSTDGGAHPDAVLLLFLPSSYLPVSRFSFRSFSFGDGSRYEWGRIRGRDSVRTRRFRYMLRKRRERSLSSPVGGTSHLSLQLLRADG
ncbi:hypothetical protein HPB48_023875 [Haemaphysalis longicornis]|uniref:Uncharacterized protein n=1 Tax=Haemaphysalis longicornis TaxID=44386 RepID=A0A9J6H786_HAELO|nr:hypothetical protein HPB48_023875 [Haemaphysalis longicornis]